MPIDAIGSIGSLIPASGIGAAAGASETDAAEKSGATDFASSLAGAVDDLQSLQANSDTLAIKAVTGSLDDIHTATIAATRAQVSIELAAAVRNKAVDAFNSIMRMQA